MDRPKVGVAVVLKKMNGTFLLGKRQGSHGAGTWAFPGGHLEYMEDVSDCAYRELEEETGIMKKDVTSFREIGFTNDKFIEENKHYITIFVEMKVDNDISAMNLEPEKCEKWEWYNNNNIPSEQFIPLKNYLEKYNQI